MSDYSTISRQLRDALGLDLGPIAVAFAGAIPDGVDRFDGILAAGCGFWELAATRTFATVAADHELCAIGVHTHNLEGATPATREELGATLKVMADLDYVRPEEVEGIPVVDQASPVVIYAPLESTPVAPDVVVLFARADQSLIVAEAAMQVDGAVAPAMGRPACAMIPQAKNSGRAAMSLGCCGARAYLDALTPQTALWTLPGAAIAAYAERIAGLARANQVLARFHQVRRDDVEAGRRPTFAESLTRMNSAS